MWASSGLPYANNSYITKWIDVQRNLGWDADVLVPGHGPIAGKKELAEMRDYFQVLGVEVASATTRK